jgi:hypothetical protein
MFSVVSVRMHKEIKILKRPVAPRNFPSVKGKISAEIIFRKSYKIAKITML